MLKPFDITSQNIPAELEDLLRDARVIQDDPITEQSNKNSKNSGVSRARAVFDAHGASLDEIARTVSNTMQRGESDSGRLKAAELALKVHGILQEIDDKVIPQITINVTNQFTQENKTLINLVVPNI